MLLYALVFVFLCAMVLSATLTGKSGAMYVAGFVRETNQGLGKAGVGKVAGAARKTGQNSNQAPSPLASGFRFVVCPKVGW